MKKLMALGAVCVFAAAAFAQDVQVGPGIASPVVSQNLGGGGGIADTLWDNGDTDGSNGLSQLSGQGQRRSTLDDFEVPAGPGWRLQDFHTLILWSDGGSNEGTGYELDIRDDNNGTPGNVIASATNTVLSESATGRSWFGRPEQQQDVTFDNLDLSPGTYWVEMHVVAPTNLFQMVRAGITLSPAWVDYEDLGGLQPASNFAGSDVDFSYSLTGVVIPEPTTLILLGLGGLALIRRR